MIPSQEEKPCKSLSILGEFIDTNIENEYRSYEIKNAIKFVKPIAIFLGILYFLFIIPDYFLIKDSNTFKYILLNRVLFFLLICILYKRLKQNKSTTSYYYWITIYEYIVAIFFFFIVYAYESPNFLIQSYGLIVIIFAIFLTPNKWFWKVLVSMHISITFFILYTHFIESVPMSEFSAAVVYTFLVIILAGISSYSTNYYKRIQYLYNNQLIKLSTTDALTGINNRFKFDEVLQQNISYSQENGTDLSIILFDIDDFKKINDDYGHLIGDEILVEISNIVKKAIRSTDFFARWGGEEFIILLPNTDKKNAIELGQRLKILISKHNFKPIGKVTCSFGIDSLLEEDDANSLVYRVDKYMYLAKETGKNQIFSKLTNAT